VAAVGYGLILLVSLFHIQRHASWVEPAIVWLTGGMPTETGNSSYLLKVNLGLQKVKVPDGSAS